MQAAINYAHTRVGDIAFAVRTRGSFYSYRPYHQEWSASVLKAMLMLAYLDMPTLGQPEAFIQFKEGLVDDKGHITVDATRQFLQKWFRDSKVFDIFEGTAQIQRLVIARRLFPDVDIP